MVVADSSAAAAGRVYAQREFSFGASVSLALGNDVAKSCCGPRLPRCGDCGQVDSLSSKNKAAAACEHEAAAPGTLPTLYELVDAERKRRIFPGPTDR